MWEYVVIEKKHLKRRRKFGFGVGANGGGSHQKSFDTDEASNFEYYSSSTETSAQSTARGGGGGEGATGGGGSDGSEATGAAATEGGTPGDPNAGETGVAAVTMPTPIDDKENSAASGNNPSASSNDTESVVVPGDKLGGESAGSTRGPEGETTGDSDGSTHLGAGGGEANATTPPQDLDPESELEGEVPRGAV